MATIERAGSRGGIVQRVGGWLDSRFGISALAYPVPRHANTLAYTLGGVTMGSFVLLVATGIYLAQYYDPTPAGAHATVVELSSGGGFGAVLGSLHFWLSAIFMVTLTLHLLRAFATAAYKAPREGIWLTGVGLFAVAGGLLFTGTSQVHSRSRIWTHFHDRLAYRFTEVRQSE